MLYFTFGTVMSGKTKHLINKLNTLKGKYLLMKPDVDFIYRKRKIVSRAGMSKEVDILIEKNTDLLHDISYDGVSYVLIDESQFLSEKHVDQLRNLKDIDVYAYGLETDFKGKLFDGSRRLLEVSDFVSELTVVCNYCKDRKASFNVKNIGDKFIMEGETIDPINGIEEKYYPCCNQCRNEKLKKVLS